MSYLFDRQYGRLPHRSLLHKLKNSSSITKRLTIDCTLDVHHGCVNTIWWNQFGTSILSGSDDQNLVVTDPYRRKELVKVRSGHRENIFSAKFLPESSDRRVVSCSGDGVIFHTNFDRPPTSHSREGCFTCHGSSTAYEVRVIPHAPNLFLSCSDDCTIRLYDLRTKSNCLKEQCNDDILIKSNWGITSMDVNPMNSNEIVCACADSSIRLYDQRKLSTQPSSTMSLSARCDLSTQGLVSYFALSDRKGQRQSRVTSVVYNPHGTEVLASYSSESIYLLDPKQSVTQEQMKKDLAIHRNGKRARTTTAKDKKSPSVNTPVAESRPSHVKRLRLRGDWSDTGPDSRPSNEEEEEQESRPLSNPSEPSNEQQPSVTPGRNPQNFFMQRMSDILTQLVTSSTSEPEPAARTTTEPDTNSAAASSPTASSSTTQSATTRSETDDSEPGTNSVFDLILDDDSPLHHEDDEDDEDEDDDSVMSEDDDSPTTMADMARRSRHSRGLITTKWDRLQKRREANRTHEDNLLKNIPSLGLLNSYNGHRNARTMIKEANFWSDSYVMSGSDCGHIFIWNKFTGDIVRIIQADGHVVNCVQPHPCDYPILASSGIDHNIKLFSPMASKPIDDTDLINRTVQRNHTMTEETLSTVTVPAAFIFRMLTSIYRVQHPGDLSGLDDDD